jgi:5'-3' exonuclease
MAIFELETVSSVCFYSTTNRLTISSLFLHSTELKMDEYAKNVEDNVRLHESGWRDRYYTDKCKADDVEANGGREHLFWSYVVGLCWVMKYYYDGCPSWKWYFPFHYGKWLICDQKANKPCIGLNSRQLHSFSELPYSPVCFGSKEH